MRQINRSELSPEVAAYLLSLEQEVSELKKDVSDLKQQNARQKA